MTPAEIIRRYAEAGRMKADRPAGKAFLLAVLAGIIIAFGCAATNTAAHALDNVSAIRIVCGLLFPFGLGMVILLGAELFTGNCLMAISVLEKQTTLAKMLHSWLVVYVGNLVGSLLLAAGCSFFGQLNFSGGGLAVYTIQVAASKCAIPFPNGVVLGFFCNVLVCMAVLCSMSASDTAGRLMGAYIPVAFFVLCGFEHCVANMYYIPAGIFAMMNPTYARLAAEAGIDTSLLTWGGFFGNLLAVTVGNIAGGVALAAVMRAGHRPAINE